MVVTRITHQPVCYVQTPISDEPSPEHLKESMNMVGYLVKTILEIHSNYNPSNFKPYNYS